ncbi:MAG: ExeM/NucH family extracellular endonuclease [Myxococcota bacterium]
MAALALALAATADAQVVISQVYGGGGNLFDRDYVELFNRGSAPVGLDGLSLQYASATGSALFAANGITPLFGALAPGEYRLVGLAAGTGGVALPAPFDAGNGATNLASASGKVALVVGTMGLACNGGSTPCDAAQLAALVDLVGYGAANFHEGATAAPAAGTTTALFRDGAGCVDTGWNGADFETGVPLPRTAATPFAPCAVDPGLPFVELTLDLDVASEADATTVTATATASAPVAGEQSVSLGVSGVGITPGDYLLSSAIVTLPDGATSGSAYFTVVDDALVEGTEIATLALANPTAGLALGATSSRTLTILDDEGCAGSATAIHAVQGAGATSPRVGEVVVVEGIVTGLFRGTAGDSLRGFFLQEEDGDADGDPATSEGLFVYEGATGLAAGLAVGDRVRATGTVAELAGKTEISALLAVERCSAGEPLPTAATVTLPVPGVPDGDLAAATAAIDAYYERFEGMRVVVPATLAVAESFELERFGALLLVAGGRIPSFTDAHAPSPAGWIDHQIEVARRTIRLDDGDDVQNAALANARPLPYPMPGLSVTNRFRSGDTLAGLTALLDWSTAGASGTTTWRLRPVTGGGYVFTPANPRPADPPAVAGGFRIASLNVLNYFTTIDTTPSAVSGPCGPSGALDCRGADSAAELVRQTDKLVAALCALDADVVGLVELENDAFATQSALVAAANAVADCGPYASVGTGPIGTDAIKVGLLYKTTTASTVGAHAILDASVDPRFLDTHNRPVLAQSFVEDATGERFTIAVAHLKSKGSGCSGPGDADAGDGQGVCNATRTSAAQALVDWLAGDPTGSGGPDFLIVGDLNSYSQEDPVAAIKAGPDDVPGTADDWLDLVAGFADSGGGAASTYTYLFEGQTGRLDHALATASLASRVAGAAVWHVNADEPPAFDYDDAIADAGESAFEAKPGALPLYAPDPFRSSDHDPVLIGLPEPGVGDVVIIGVLGMAAFERRRPRDRAPR